MVRWRPDSEVAIRGIRCRREIFKTAPSRSDENYTVAPRPNRHRRAATQSTPSRRDLDITAAPRPAIVMTQPHLSTTALPPPHSQAADATSRARRQLFVTLNCLLLLSVAVFFRGWRLDHLPGVNGDEAWMGVQAQRFLDSLQASPTATEKSVAPTAVEWVTPTGNPLNWFLFWPTVLLHAWLPPSIGLLRLTAMISGALALFVNYAFCKRAFGLSLAVISTVLLAVMPINIAYSRFGWDASQSLLVTLPVLYCSLIATKRPDRHRIWLLGATVAQAAALLVHPTNIFTAPLLFVAAVACYRQEIQSIWQRARGGGPGSFWPRVAVLVTGSLAVIAAAVFWLMCVTAEGRTFSPGEFGTFLTRWFDLFSGITVYQFIPGSLTESGSAATLAYRGMAWLVIMTALWGAFQAWRQRRSLALDVLLLGTLANLLGFYLVAGPEAIRPHFERYGMCLIASGALVLAWGAQWWWERFESVRAVAGRLAVPAVAWLMLATFGWFYVGQFLSTGGESHLAFRTADVEPKQAALADLVARNKGSKTLIVAEDWWNYWPLLYLSHDNPQVTVWQASELSAFPTALRSASTTGANARATLSWVGFANTPAAAKWKSALEQAGCTVSESRCSDYADRAVVFMVESRP